jgi:hypothetical protein
LVNDFAIRSFRDTGDGDYIAARMACRAELVVRYLWSAQQAIEKYLKCILLLNRIPAREVRHDLRAGLSAINKSGDVKLNLTKSTRDFISYLDDHGRFRYLEVSNHAFGLDLIRLDRAVWELRRFCTLDPGPHQAVLTNGLPAPKVSLRGGYLEQVIADPKHSARGPLIWQNGFFGKRTRRAVRLRGWLRASNSPLYLNPQILDEVVKFVYLPQVLEREYRNLKGPN